MPSLRTLRLTGSFLVIAWILASSRSAGLDFDAVIRAWAGPVQTNDVEQQQVDQRYNFQLRQEVSPWLQIFGSYRFTGFRSSFDNLPDFERTTSQPGLGLLYDRPTFSARLQAFDRAIRSTVDSQNLDVSSFLGDLDWRPRWGPRFLLRFGEDKNTADPAVFGRDTQIQRVAFSILEQRYRTWTARYTYEFTDTLNNLSSFEQQDQAHILRVTYGDRWLRDRWSISADSRIRYLDRAQNQGLGLPLNQPLPLSQGLFATNTAPEVGQLGSVPSLIDGDREIPATPPIDIGGSNTFRNIGVDLGLTRPITQLEITVDRPSGPGVLWEVWGSPDNLNWSRVPGAQSIWDGAFLRYVVNIPETQNRFFKTVNLSTNAVPEVLVTEIRALVESAIGDQESASGTDGWLDLRTTVAATRNVELTLFGLGRRDLGLALGGATRSRDTLDYGGQLRVALTRELEFRFDYRVTDLEEDQIPVFESQQEQTSASLEWRPLSTVNVRATAARRDETQGTEPIRSSDTFILRAVTDLLPRLSLSNQWTYSVIDDPFAGFSQTNQQWNLGFEARPTGNWTLGGTVTYARYDSTGVINLTDRTTINLLTTWQVFRYLSVTGNWNYGVDNLQNTLSQRYSASWSPGRRIALTLSYSQTDSGEFNLTSSTNGTLNYRLNRWFTMWASVNNSKTVVTLLSESETTSYRFGVKLTI